MASNYSWHDRVSTLSQNDALASRTCKTYVKHQEREICQCGRLKATHSVTSIPNAVLEERADNTKSWNEFRDSKKTEMKVYGVLPRNNAKFIRCDNRQRASVLYDLILGDRNNHRPSLLISAYGGARYFTLSERLEKDFITGIIDLATRAGM